MLKLTIGEQELFDEETKEFRTVGGITIELEHSLVSLSKWESEFEKPFLTGDEKSTEEVKRYIELMILTPDYPTDVLEKLTPGDFSKINAYLDSKQSATTIYDRSKPKGPPQTITSELIYYWMIAFNIPFECENWHLNRLFALVKICGIKNAKPTKTSRGDLAQQRRELNAERKARLGTTG